MNYAQCMDQTQTVASATPLFARQPIFDAALDVSAYELLFRGDETSGEAATAEVLLSAFDQSLFDDSSSLPLFVNFPEQLLLHMPPMDRERLVVEILETVTVTDTLVKAVAELHSQGYRIALDDYAGGASFAPLLPHVDVVKVDVLELTPEELAETVGTLKRAGHEVLAEKVESHAMYEQCRALGADFYQGFFFAKPNIVHGKQVSAAATAVLKLLTALQEPSMTAGRLEEIILSDTVLTYRIIKLVNSAAYRRASEITSVAGAVAMLGLQQLTAFASLLSLSKLDRRPRELGSYTALRAAFCQRLGAAAGVPFSPESLFTLGVLSCSEAYFDQPMATLAQGLPLHEDFLGALLKRTGLLGQILTLAQRYQEGAWDTVDWRSLAAYGIDRAMADAAYQDSVAWCEAAAPALRTH